MRLDVHCEVYCHRLFGNSERRPFMNFLKVLAEKSQYVGAKLHLFALCE